MAKQKKIDLGHMTEEEKMKYEIAGELGLLDRVLNDGWRSLTAKETGRIGGLVTRRKRQMAAEEQFVSVISYGWNNYIIFHIASTSFYRSVCRLFSSFLIQYPTQGDCPL